MINSLSKTQTARFQEFIDKWKAIGLCTEPANRREAEQGVIEAYKITGLAAPKVVWCGSPLSQGLTRALVFGLKDAEVKIVASVKASVKASVWDSVWDSVGDSVGASVWASVGDSVGASVWASVGASVRASVGASVGASVRDSVGASVGASVKASVKDSVGASVKDSVKDSVWASVGASVGASGYGQHDANWLGFYDYFRTVCGLEEQTCKLFGLWTISQNAGWFLPHKNLCWISERHNVLNRNAQGRLHKDGSAALAYPDGFEIYALNGIRMKPCYVTTPASELDPKIVLAEANVDIRRELIRKITMPRFLAVCPHKVLDSLGGYSLLNIPLSEQLPNTRWLRMRNPSIDAEHVEAVHPDCATVQQAINWRAGNINVEWKPELVT